MNINTIADLTIDYLLKVNKNKHMPIKLQYAFTSHFARKLAKRNNLDIDAVLSSDESTIYLQLLGQDDI